MSDLRKASDLAHEENPLAFVFYKSLSSSGHMRIVNRNFTVTDINDLDEGNFCAFASTVT